MSAINAKSATTALVFGHLAGMIDLAALPVWVGTLAGGFQFGNTQAGGLVTAFLVGVVLTSIVLARIFHRVPVRWAVPGAYAASAASFLVMSLIEPSMRAFLALHVVCGIATGIALSTTHGTMGRTANPHRVWAIASAGFGVMALLFLGIAPRVIADSGPSTLFLILALIQGAAALVTGGLFPNSGFVQADVEFKAFRGLPAQVWYVIIALTLMNFVQAITFSYVERIGMARDFGLDRVQMLLLSLGIINLFPALIAAYLETRIKPLTVGIAGAGVQAVLSLAITTATGFPLYALSSLFFAAIIIFTHTFLFGFLAKADPSGRAVAGTPAMTMSGSALAPFIGGFLSDTIGYPAIGVMSAAVACVTVTLFARARAKAAQVLATV
jgi:predicted MFS family arabinose efflux permease